MHSPRLRPRTPRAPFAAAARHFLMVANHRTIASRKPVHQADCPGAVQASSSRQEFAWTVGTRVVTPSVYAVHAVYAARASCGCGGARSRIYERVLVGLKNKTNHGQLRHCCSPNGFRMDQMGGHSWTGVDHG